MSKEELYQIEELPDLKVAWHESYKYLNEPLLEYVWKVANHFLPDYKVRENPRNENFQRNFGRIQETRIQ